MFCSIHSLLELRQKKFTLSHTYIYLYKMYTFYLDPRSEIVVPACVWSSNYAGPTSLVPPSAWCHLSGPASGNNQRKCKNPVRRESRDCVVGVMCDVVCLLGNTTLPLATAIILLPVQNSINPGAALPDRLENNCVRSVWVIIKTKKRLSFESIILRKYFY